MAVSFKQAAFRHFRGGSLLEKENHRAVASHLYGLSAECALKAILHGTGSLIMAGNRPQPPYDVHIDKLWGHYMTAISGRTLPRYCPGCSIANPFTSFKINHRYEDDLFAFALDDHAEGALASICVLEAAITDGVC